MGEVLPVDDARTSQGRYGGAPAQVRPDDPAVLVVAEAVRRADVAAERVDDVMVCVANRAGVGQGVAMPIEAP